MQDERTKDHQWWIAVGVVKIVVNTNAEWIEWTLIPGSLILINANDQLYKVPLGSHSFAGRKTPTL
jgi:hypothetical protein